MANASHRGLELREKLWQHLLVDPDGLWVPERGLGEDSFMFLGTVSWCTCFGFVRLLGLPAAKGPSQVVGYVRHFASSPGSTW